MERSLFKHFVEVHSSSILLFNLRLSQGIRKICSSLHDIEMSLLAADVVELDDLMKEREQKINLEFARRFSRNNLYPIHLKISKLENEIVAFRSYKYCKFSKAIILRALILALVSQLSNSVQMYEKFLRKSKLKSLLKLDDLMDYLRSAFQMMTYVVDTSFIETLDVSETISVILKLSRERKCKLNSTDSTIKNKKQFSRNQKIFCKLPQGKKQFANKITYFSKQKPKSSTNSKNSVNTRRVSHSLTDSLVCREVASRFENDIQSKEKNLHGYSPMKLQKIHFELCNKIMHELTMEVSNDMTECISHLITDAYKHELVNTSTNLR